MKANAVRAPASVSGQSFIWRASICAATTAVGDINGEGVRGGSLPLRLIDMSREERGKIRPCPQHIHQKSTALEGILAPLPLLLQCNKLFAIMQEFGKELHSRMYVAACGSTLLRVSTFLSLSCLAPTAQNGRQKSASFASFEASVTTRKYFLNRCF